MNSEVVTQTISNRTPAHACLSPRGLRSRSAIRQISFGDTDVMRARLTLTPDPPSDVDIKECEDRDDNAEGGSKDLLERQDPSRWRRYRRGYWAVCFGDVA